MLSLFPQLLFLAPTGTSLLRIAAGLTYLFLAYWHGKKIRELSDVKFIVVGKGTWIIYVAILFEGITGALLFTGYLTQAAAIAGALMALKSLIWSKRYPQFFPLNRAASALLLAICLSLIVSGAGSFAFDLPL